MPHNNPPFESFGGVPDTEWDTIRTEELNRALANHEEVSLLPWGQLDPLDVAHFIKGYADLALNIEWRIQTGQNEDSPYSLPFVEAQRFASERANIDILGDAPTQGLPLYILPWQIRYLGIINSRGFIAYWQDRVDNSGFGQAYQMSTRFPYDVKERLKPVLGKAQRRVEQAHADRAVWLATGKLGPMPQPAEDTLQPWVPQGATGEIYVNEREAAELHHKDPWAGLSAAPHDVATLRTFILPPEAQPPHMPASADTRPAAASPDHPKPKPLSEELHLPSLGGTLDDPASQGTTLLPEKPRQEDRSGDEAKRKRPPKRP